VILLDIREACIAAVRRGDRAEAMVAVVDPELGDLRAGVATPNVRICMN
jgi:hypothetical protein